MKRLTIKEEEMMNHFWRNGALFVRELMLLYDEPKPHFNTLSTVARALECYGFLSHKIWGNTHQYYPVISQQEYGEGTLQTVISKYFHDSYLHAVSSFVENEQLSIEELKELIDKVKQKKHGK